MEKKIIEDYLKIKKDILAKKDIFLDKLFDKNLEEKNFEDIIEKFLMTFSLIKNREYVMKSSFDIIKIVNEKIIKLILKKEDKIIRDYIKKKN